MLPYIPVIIVSPMGNTYQGLALERGDTCVYICEKRLKEATIALLDLSALISEEVEVFDYQDMKIPKGALYAIHCVGEKIIEAKDLVIVIGSIKGRRRSEVYKEDETMLRDISIPVRLSSLLSRMDERYVVKF